LSDFPKIRNTFAPKIDFPTNLPERLRLNLLLHYYYSGGGARLVVTGNECFSVCWSNLKDFESNTRGLIRFGSAHISAENSTFLGFPNQGPVSQWNYRRGSAQFTVFEKKKPVIFVIPVYLAMGGVEKNAVEILSALKDKFQFVVIGLERLSESQGSTAEQFALVTDEVFELGEVLLDCQRLNAIEQLSAIYKPDLVWICNGSPWLIANLSKIRNIFSEIPIIEQMVYDTKEGWVNALNMDTSAYFDFHIATTDKIRDVLISEKGIFPEKISTIYSCLDSKRFELPKEFLNSKEVSISSRVIRIGFVGRFTKQKDPIAAIKLIEQLIKKNVRIEFLMVGDGELLPVVESYAFAKGMEQVKFVGFQKDLLPIYKSLDALFITSAYEGLPIAMLEALCCGVPVFSTDVGDIRSVLERFNNGFVSKGKVGSNQFFQDAMKFLNNIELWLRRASLSSFEVRESFSREMVSKKYSSLWDMLILGNEAKR
jgi:glycosyltransferase involved in cell wall biosynthesis